MAAEATRRPPDSGGCSQASRRSGRCTVGLTLIELLVAACVAATALGAAWPWVWNAGATARAQVARAQAATSLSFALRVIDDDLAQATAVLTPTGGRDPETALYLRHDHPGEPPETVAIVWDAPRKVLWRKASGTYLADRVDAFSVRYFRSDGTQLLGDDFAAAEWATSVARVCVSVRTRDGGAAATGVLDVVPGPA